MYIITINFPPNIIINAGTIEKMAIIIEIANNNSIWTLLLLISPL